LRAAARLAAAILIAASALGTTRSSLRAADLSRGQKLFAACAVCHDPASPAKLGPILRGIAGRRAGTVPGFRYSRAMRRSGITWSAPTLDAYLADPQGTVPGNAMPYPGMADAKQRADLIAYLLTLH